MLEDTVSAPLLPAICEISDRLVSPLLVATLAVTPMLAALMAPARPASVLPEELSVTVCAVPLPTWIETAPVRVVLALVGIEVNDPFGFCTFRPPSNSCCKSESVGDPYRGSGLPVLSLPCCVFKALIREL